jgi:glutamate/tyrosine decarboxylase-like PLP-dependent enzyme
MSLEQLLTVIQRDVLSYPFGNGHPRFHAWVNSPPDRAGLLADLLASAADPSCAGGNHAGVHLERLVIRWLAALVGLPPGAGGLLVSGGPLATVTALAAARRRAEHPVAVVGSAGTVSTGTIDPLDEIADVCARHEIWLHVDGSYGTPAILTDRYRARLAGLRHADSIAIDPHKWLYVPVDAGALLARDPERLRAEFSLVPAYLRTESDPAGVSDAAWFSEYGPEQTRPLRALRVWAALASTG